MPTQARTSGARKFFSAHGTLAQWHPNYEYRAGQVEMAEAVEAALADKRHLIVEAGTGTGKTLAYLVPALASGKRIVVSTGTKNLQEQLFFKDVPFLLQHFERPLKVCYMKGRNNYACRQKIYDVEKQPVFAGLEEVADFEIIREWEKTTEFGDRAEIKTLPESSTAWAKVDARAELCSGQKCPNFSRCFLTLMHQRAAESDIIIVNHHLFFADLSIKLEADGASDAGVLPECGAVIFDEAHELEEVAGSFFGISVSNLRMDELTRDVEHLLQRERLYTPQMSGAIQSVRERSQLFFSLLPANEGRFAFDSRREFLEENGEEFLALNQALYRLGAELEQLPQKPEEVFTLTRRARELQVQLRFVMESEDPNTVFWIERRGFRAPVGSRRKSSSFTTEEKNTGGRTNIFLQATPIEVGQILRECLWSKLETSVLTSATLAVGGGFDYIRQRLGLDHARELIVASHFDYESQAILYVPPDLPDPRTPQFAAEAAGLVRRLLEITRGRAFVLFTSYAQMNEIYQRLLGQLEFPMLKQGDAPKSALLEEFRVTPHAVLFGTSSFWQGVDVQGEQLSCVIIDRLPFAVPSDPVVAARVKAIDAGGGNAFYEYQVPSAVITLKQGFGRLIRSLHDRGLLALLDNRILKKSYGRVFVESLPNYSRTTELKRVEEFFGVSS